ncbi:MAG: tetratricopeptide repeat protein [Dongiaceae bacterium]
MTDPAPQIVSIERALSLHRAGHRDQAETAYRALLAATPDYADAWHFLAVLLQETGRRDEASAAVTQAIARNPTDPFYRLTDGTLALGEGKLDAAIESFRTALALKPDFAAAATNLGLALQRAGKSDEAEAAQRQALALEPGNTLARYNLGQLQHRRGRLADAIATYDIVLQSDPRHLAAHLNRALALRQSGRFDDAIEAYRTAIDLSPTGVDGWLGLGLARNDKGDLDGAIDSFRAAIAQAPDRAEAHLNLGLALLTRGRFAEAWPHYARRWQAPPLLNHRRPFTAPEWDGSALGSRRLLVHAEQGLGDTIQFAQLLPKLGADRAQLILEMPALLIPLMRPLESCATLVAKGATLPPFDCHLPLMDLPQRLGITEATIPNLTGLLAAEPQRLAHWRAWIAGLSVPPARRRIALCWRGSDDNPENDRRSIPPALLAPLFALPGFSFISLQKNAASPHPAVIVPAEPFDPKGAAFLDSAAILSLVDAAITVDTSIAHLAGSLGCRTLNLLPFVADWRWGADRSDCPWYPTMRLIRQKAPGDWASVVRTLVAELGA